MADLPAADFERAVRAVIRALDENDEALYFHAREVLRHASHAQCLEAERRIMRGHWRQDAPPTWSVLSRRAD